MRRPKKRTVLIIAAVLLLAALTTITWEVADWPPVRLILKYGFPPTGGPTGNVKVIEGIEFIELKRGYVWMDPYHPLPDGGGGNLLGRICRPFGLPYGDPPKFASTRHTVGHWVEVPSDGWVMPDWGGKGLPMWEDDSPRALDGQLQALISRLNGAAPGEFRTPTRREWETAEALRILSPSHVPEGYPDHHLGAWLSRVRDYLTFEDGVETLTTTFDGSSWLGFRLVWIPRED